MPLPSAVPTLPHHAHAMLGGRTTDFCFLKINIIVLLLSSHANNCTETTEPEPEEKHVCFPLGFRCLIQVLEQQSVRRKVMEPLFFFFLSYAQFTESFQARSSTLENSE